MTDIKWKKIKDHRGTSYTAYTDFTVGNYDVVLKLLVERFEYDKVKTLWLGWVFVLDCRGEYCRGDYYGKEKLVLYTDSGYKKLEDAKKAVIRLASKRVTLAKKARQFEKELLRKKEEKYEL